MAAVDLGPLGTEGRFLYSYDLSSQIVCHWAKVLQQLRNALVYIFRQIAFLTEYSCISDFQDSDKFQFLLDWSYNDKQDEKVLVLFYQTNEFL